MTRYAVSAIVGPTAAGKSALATRVAKQAGGEIVSIDSAQVYRGMDIGTAKPSPEDRRAVPHHLIDVVDCDYSMTVVEFRDRARAAIDEIHERDERPILVGGSGLYFRAVVDPLQFPGTDPEVRSDLYDQADEEGPQRLYERLQALDHEAAERIESNNTRRIVRALEVIELTGRKFSSFHVAWETYDSIYDLEVVGLAPAIEELDRRIDDRVGAMMARGLLDEVKELESRGIRRSQTAPQALGYAQLLAHLDGEVTYEQAVEEIKVRTRRFARRQLSWFRADPRVEWFEDPDQATVHLLKTAEAPAG